MFTKDERYNIQLILFMAGLFMISDKTEFVNLSPLVENILHTIVVMILFYRGLKVLMNIDKEK